MKQRTSLKLFFFFICVLPLYSSAYSVGDFGSAGNVTWGSSGSWNTWNGAAWVATAALPSMTDNVFILAGNTVLVNSSPYSCNSLTIEAGAKLWSNSSSNNYIWVYGNITNTGTIGNGATFDGISFSIEGATCTASGTGAWDCSRIRKNGATNTVTNFIIDTDINLSFSTGTTTQIYNSCDNTSFNITINATRTLNIKTSAGFAGNVAMDGVSANDAGERAGSYTVNGTLIISGTLYLTTNNTTLPVTFTIGTTGTVKAANIIANASGSVTHVFNMSPGALLQITGTPYTNTVSLTNNIYNFSAGSTIEYSAAGIQNIDGNLPYANLKFSGSGNKSGSSTINVSGDLTVTAAAFVPGANTVNVGGNWTDYNNLGFTEAGSTIVFNGTANQTITSSAGENFINLTINKTSGKVILASSPVTQARIAGVLNLTSGNIISGGSYYPLIQTTGSVINASNNSFVEGPCGKTGNANFIFPVGKVAEYRPIGIASVSSSATFLAEYFHVNPDVAAAPGPYDRTAKAVSLDHVGECEYWGMRTLAAASIINANVILSWDTYSCGVSAMSALRVTSWYSAAWNDLGNSTTTGSTSIGTVAAASSYPFPTGSANYTPFNLASGTSANPLPMTLISFSAKKENDKVKLEWVTAAEVNNDYFTVERSSDVHEFIPVVKHDGAGNSNVVLDYTEYDNAPAEGVLYYRLRQTDFNGHYSFSNIVAVDFRKEKNNIVTVFPNPASDKVYINMPSAGNKNYLIHFFDMDGREVLIPSCFRFDEDNLQSIDINSLPAGVYLLQIQSGWDVQQVRVEKR